MCICIIFWSVHINIQYILMSEMKSQRVSTEGTEADQRGSARHIKLSPKISPKMHEEDYSFDDESSSENQGNQYLISVMIANKNHPERKQRKTFLQILDSKLKDPRTDKIESEK